MSLWELPSVLLYNVISYAAQPTHRARVLCQSIAPLCRASRKVILEDDQSVALWDIVLKEEYGVEFKGRPLAGETPRRSCKRLRRRPVEKVRDAHILMKDNTEIAYFYLSELSHCSSKNALSKKKLCGILDEYGPHLRINNTVSSGGTYLVEVCRAHVSRRTILQCVEELVMNRGANVDLATLESQNSTLTPICVAATRAMPAVVQFLLDMGASTEIKCSGRFRLNANSRRSVRCTNATPLEFAKSMRDAEISAGCENVVDLNKCISMLQSFQKKIDTASKCEPILNRPMKKLKNK